MVFIFDPCGIACVLFTFFIVLYADYVVIFHLIRPVLHNSIAAILNTVGFNIVAFLLILSHLSSVLSDPGLLPLGAYSLKDTDALQRPHGWTACSRCSIYRPPRAHHCRICRRCVRRMDHHCPWINNCVGERNRKYFMLFLIYVGILCIYALGLVIACRAVIAPPTTDKRTMMSSNPMVVMHTVLLVAICCLFGLFVLAIFTDQYKSIVEDETAVEALQQRHPSRANDDMEAGNYRRRLPKRKLLREVFGDANFWNTTGKDGEILPIRPSQLLTDEDTESSHLPEPLLRRNPSQTPVTESIGGGFYKIDEIRPEISRNSTSSHDELCLPYPRLALTGPLLAVSGYGQSKPELILWRLCQSPSSRRQQRLHLPRLVDALATNSSSICWSAFTAPSNATATQTDLYLAVGRSSGSVILWDLESDSAVYQIEAGNLCGQLLRCASIQTSQSSGNNKPLVLTGGRSGQMGLWDMRSSSNGQPQSTFPINPGPLRVPTSDLLWLSDVHFASTSDHVDRDICDANLAVWDIRVSSKPISHQIFQERWGCSRMALQKSSSGTTLRFAVQTHGNAIVEVHVPNERHSSSSTLIKMRYRLEKLWRYEGHECQAHPLGLAYSPNGDYIASGSSHSPGPFIWLAKDKSQSDLRGDCLTNYTTHGSHLFTDVVWAPRGVFHAKRDTLIGVQMDGTVSFYIRD